MAVARKAINPKDAFTRTFWPDYTCISVLIVFIETSLHPKKRKNIPYAIIL